MLRHHQPPKIAPHGRRLLHDVHDVVHAVRGVHAGPPDQLPCPLVAGDDLAGQDELAAVLDSHPGAGTRSAPIISSSDERGPATSVSAEERRIRNLFDRVETIEEVAVTLPEGDDRRARLLALSRDALAEEATVRPVIAAKILGLSEKTVWLGRLELGPRRRPGTRSRCQQLQLGQALPRRQARHRLPGHGMGSEGILHRYRGLLRNTIRTARPRAPHRTRVARALPATVRRAGRSMPSPPPRSPSAHLPGSQSSAART